MNTVTIIDYGMCNLDSVKRAIELCGGIPLITNNANEIYRSDRIILPGVGAFHDAMKNIRKLSLDSVLSEAVIGRGIQFLGICLGMQLMAERGYEGNETRGLGWIKGEVLRLEPNDIDERIPHIGWNEIVIQQSSPLLSEVPSGKDFYFVHSYHFQCSEPKCIIATTPYCGEFASIVQKNNIHGVQFHPEKSQHSGFQILKNFLAL